ncbi:uncharacterized protein BP01DRAFT_356840 [Aspergillus saccharolyticus JOP 1030-1]|uniref:Uncharacterized protein n=1 Tax=Aspergillus saccharolyticus JOP 1030-1 TaxID=1450539 RepID=A0A318ZCX4_9EURO|nr:hypothetical protein BP01DRAFT_356840 [Aspergillus saccharolyticus JOP 1030-1]PYH45341.1 hypothetical protein BP01DRAFT_356840 [Aspergillus saccharolyticus JOP 1030-1]
MLVRNTHALFKHECLSGWVNCCSNASTYRQRTEFAQVERGQGSQESKKRNKKRKATTDSEWRSKVSISTIPTPPSRLNRNHHKQPTKLPAYTAHCARDTIPRIESSQQPLEDCECICTHAGSLSQEGLAWRRGVNIISKGELLRAGKVYGDIVWVWVVCDTMCWQERQRG